MEVESLYEYITSGIILSSKTNWYEHGEKLSKYILNLEKRNKAKLHLHKLMTSSDTEIPDHLVIIVASLWLKNEIGERQDSLRRLG